MIVSDVDREIKDRKMQTLQSLLTSSSSATKAKQNSSTPGQIIDGVRSTDGFLKGHGTQVSDGFLRSTVSGVIERVNKLVSVKALKAKYNPETGDVVIGRIIMIAQKRWRVDINSRQDAVLQLSSVNLPSGQQRRRNEASLTPLFFHSLSSKLLAPSKNATATATKSATLRRPTFPS